MIGKEVAVGNGFRGVLAYLEDASQHEIGFVDSRNVANEDLRGIAREMRAVAKGSLRVEKPVRHLLLSWQPGEAASQDAMTAAADRFLALLGLENRQARFVMHAEKGHQHLHMVVNAVGSDGHAWNANKSQSLAIECGRKVAREMGFVTVERDVSKERDADRPRPKTAQEQRIEGRTGRSPLRERVPKEAVAALRAATSWEDAHTQLARYGFAIDVYANPKNPKRAGLSLIDPATGETSALSALGSSYGKSAMEKRLGKFQKLSKGLARDVEVGPPESTRASISVQDDAEVERAYPDEPADGCEVDYGVREPDERSERRERETPRYGPVDEAERDDVPGMRHPNRSRWQVWREEILSDVYERDFTGSELARYWRLERVDEGFVFKSASGWLIDVGERVVARFGNDFEIRAMLELVSIKGWEAVEFTGDNDFKQRAMTAALRRGISVEAGGLDAELLERCKAGLAAEKPHVISRLAHEALGNRYVGIIEAVDRSYVYQRVGDELIAHDREAFGEDRAYEFELAIGRPNQIVYEFDGPTLECVIERELWIELG